MKTMNMKTMKIINSTIVASSMLLVGSLQAASEWTNTSADGLWTTAGNWANGFPSSGGDVGIHGNLIGGPLIESGDAALSKGTYLARDGDASLTMTGGTLTTVDTFQTTQNSASGGFKATVDISGDAAITVGTSLQNRFGNLDLTISDTASFTADHAWASRYEDSHTDIKLYGGSFNISNTTHKIYIGTGTLLIDITEGQLINAGDWTNTYNGYVIAGQITGYGGSGTVDVSYDIANDQTIVTGVIPEPSAAGLLVGLGVLSLSALRRRR